MRRKILAVALALMITLTLLCSPSLASFKAKVYSSKVTVYKKASTSSAKYGTLKRGTTVTVVQFRDNWAKVKYKGKTGFCSTDSLIRVKGLARYAQESLSIYKKATTSSKIVTTVQAGKKLYVYGTSGHYYLVKYSGKTGYALQSAIGKKKPSDSPTPSPTPESPTPTVEATPSPTATAKPTPTPTVEPNDGKFKTRMPVGLESTQTTFDTSMSNEEKIEYIIYRAQKQLGKPYSSNPTPPNSYDCARFSRWCFNKAKIKIMATAYDQGYDNTYRKISKPANLKRGDLVIFNTNKSDGDLSDHTGIYLGYGYFIHASSGGGAVGVSNLLSGYYKEAFSWGRRILE